MKATSVIVIVATTIAIITAVAVLRDGTASVLESSASMPTATSEDKLDIPVQSSVREGAATVSSPVELLAGSRIAESVLMRRRLIRRSDSSPLADATVTFWADNDRGEPDRLLATTRTDADGLFSLISSELDGRVNHIRARWQRVQMYRVGDVVVPVPIGAPSDGWCAVPESMGLDEQPIVIDTGWSIDGRLVCSRAGADVLVRSSELGLAQHVSCGEVFSVRDIPHDIAKCSLTAFGDAGEMATVWVSRPADGARAAVDLVAE